jgi:hypothetical protein
MIDSPQRHRVHRDIKFIALPRDTGKAIPSAASRHGIKNYALKASNRHPCLGVACSAKTGPDWTKKRSTLCSLCLCGEIK